MNCFHLLDGVLTEASSIPDSVSCIRIDEYNINISTGNRKSSPLIINGSEIASEIYIETDKDKWIIDCLIRGYDPRAWKITLSDIDIPYIENTILAMYSSFDSAHKQSHADAVIKDSLEMAESLGINKAICYLAAAYHDIGLSIDRKTHHIESARLFREDRYIKSILNDYEMNLIAEAIEDHRASSSTLPRSIFGIVISDSDRQLDPETVVERTVAYGLANFSGDKSQHFERTKSHLEEKYSENGYMRCYLESKKHRNNMQQLHYIAENTQKLYELFEVCYSKLTKN